MSIVKIQGNASGTGTLTIAAPNTNSDATINLPTFTGGEFIVSNSSGNVGIGTSTIGSAGVSLTASYNLGWVQSAGESVPNVFRQSSSAATVVANGYRYSATANGFASSYSSSWAKSAITLDGGTIRFYTDTAATVAAGTDVTPTERMRIDSSGNLLVGTTSTSDTVVGAKMLSSGRVTSTMASSSGSESTLHVYSTGAAAYRFYVTMAGTIFATNTTITAISDQRLKENIQDLDVGLDKIMALKPRKFDWKASKGKDIKGDRGWIAQEFEQVFPDMVDEWKDPAPEGEEPYKSVRADLIPVLVKAIQEQQAIITALTARVAALEGQA